MADHIFSVPCLRVIQDKVTNLYSIMDIVESATIDAEKSMAIPQFKLLSKWVKSSDRNEIENFEVKFSITQGKKKKKILIDSFNVRIPENSLGITMILDVGPIEVSEICLWNIVVEWKQTTEDKRWKLVATLPLKLIEKKKNH